MQEPGIKTQYFISYLYVKVIHAHNLLKEDIPNFFKSTTKIVQLETFPKRNR